MRRPAALAAAAALLMFSFPAQAQLRDAGFDLARLDVSARAAALAGSMGGLAGSDATVLFTNPAFLTGEMDRSVALGYVNSLSDVNAGTALYARTVPRFGVDAALGIRFLSYGDFDRTGADGTFDGTTFGASEAAVTLTASRVVYPNLRVGGSGHALFASIADASAQALALDLGATYEVPSQQLVIGASLNGVGAVLSSLGEEDDAMPTDLRISVAKQLRYIPLTVTVSGYELQYFEGATVGDSSAVKRALDHVLVGGELQLGQALALRAGYSPRRGRALRGDGRLDLAGLGAGFGINIRRFALDYAFTGWSESGAVHQVGVRTRL